MYKEFNLFEEDGRLVSSTITRRQRLGGDWVVFYKRPLRALAESNASGAAIKVYLWLASKQTYERFVMTTPSAIANALGFTYETVRVCLKWLEAEHYLQRHVVEGNCGYLLNPDITTKGVKNNKEKKTVWAARQGGFWIDLSKDKIVDVETGEVHKVKGDNDNG